MYEHTRDNRDELFGEIRSLAANENKRYKVRYLAIHNLHQPWGKEILHFAMGQCPEAFNALTIARDTWWYRRQAHLNGLTTHSRSSRDRIITELDGDEELLTLRSSSGVNVARYTVSEFETLLSEWLMTQADKLFDTFRDILKNHEWLMWKKTRDLMQARRAYRDDPNSKTRVQAEVALMGLRKLPDFDNLIYHSPRSSLRQAMRALAFACRPSFSSLERDVDRLHQTLGDIVLAYYFLDQDMRHFGAGDPPNEYPGHGPPQRQGDLARRRLNLDFTEFVVKKILAEWQKNPNPIPVLTISTDI